MGFCSISTKFWTVHIFIILACHDVLPIFVASADVPVIFDDPKNETRAEGQSIMLWCNVKKTPLGVATWQKDGQKLSIGGRVAIFGPSGSDKSLYALTISSLVRKDEGLYRCTVSNGVKTVSSSSNTGYLTVNYPPKILASPPDFTRLERENVTLTCRYEGKPLPSIEWKKDGRKVNVNSIKRFSLSGTGEETNRISSLTIFNLRRTDEGKYKCVVNNSYATALSGETQLVVNYPANILASPISVTKIEKEIVRLTCQYEGKPKSSVVWFKNERILNPQSNSRRLGISVDGNESNATSFLAITNLNRTDEGNYKCVVSNRFQKNITSTKALLIVNYPAKFLGFSSVDPKLENENATLICHYEGKPLPAVEWVKDGRKINLNSNPRLAIFEAGNETSRTSSLTLYNLDRTDEGRYRCVISNIIKANVSTPESPLIVNYPAMILTSPSHESKLEREDVTLTCRYEGKPMSSVEWVKDGKVLNMNLSPRLSVSNTGDETSSTSSLTLNNLTRTDEGKYKCVASNRFQVNSSSEAQLTVNYPAKILEILSEDSKLEKENATFICQYEGKPMATVKWVKDGTTLDVGSNSRISLSGRGDETRRISSLTISKLKRTDEGSYKCVINNRIKTNVSSPEALFKVNYPSRILASPSNFTRLERESVTLTCQYEGKPLSIVEWVKDGRKVNAISNPRMSISFTGDETNRTSSLKISILRRTDEGKYICKVSNSVKANVFSSEAQLTVNYPAKILASPSSDPRLEKADVTLTCQFEGKPLPSFAWFRDGTKLNSKWSVTLAVGGYKSSANSSLTIFNVTRADEGKYKCVVSNKYKANVSSSETYLKINYPPKIINFLSADQILEKTNTTLTCQYEGKPIPNLQWFKDGSKVNVDNNPRLTILWTGNIVSGTSYLSIYNLKRSDEGKYKCVASNVFQANVSSAEKLLTINYPPKILASPSADSKLEREDVTVTCSYEGKPMSSVEWVKDGRKVNKNSNPRLRIAERGDETSRNSSLTISKLERTDEGLYKCIVSNRIEANVSSEEAKITVNYPAKIIASSSNFTKLERENMTFICQYEGKPASTVEWLKDGTKLNVYSSERMNISETKRGTSRTSYLKISFLRRTDEAQYRCRVSNRIKNVSSVEAHLTVNYPAKLLKSSSSEFRLETENVTLSCQYEGKPMASVEWFKDGTKLTPLSNSRLIVRETGKEINATSFLTIISVNRTDEGKYICVLSNNVKANVSGTGAMLTVDYPPRILSSSSDTYKLEKENITLTCIYEGKPMSSVEWVKDGTKVKISSHTKLSIIKTGDVTRSSISLRISNLTRLDEGKYKCVASNTIQANISSKEAHLRINYPAKILRSPAALTRLERENMTITCHYEGKPLPSIEWYKDDTKINFDERLSLSRKADGASWISFITITNLTRTDEGKYKCVVNNSIVANISSGEAQLTVNYPIKILASPSNNQMLEGENATLNCIYEGKPMPSVEWFRYGTKVNVTSNPRIKISETRHGTIGSSSLTIALLTVSDQGKYKCVVSKLQASVSSSEAQLTINYPPKILASPLNDSKLEGQDVTLSCQYEGKPLSSVEWIKDGRKLQVTSNPRLQLNLWEIWDARGRRTHKSFLAILRLQRTDQGNYKCLVSNRIEANISSAEAHLTVNYPPVIFSQPRNETKIEGQDVTLLCELEGKPLVNVTWKKDGHTIEQSKPGKIHITKPNVLGRTNSSLTITSLTRDDEGFYTCTASNDVNTVTSRADVGYLAVKLIAIHIVTSPSNQTAVEWQPISLPCNVSGYPAPTVKWWKDGLKLNDTSDHIWTQSSVTNTLTIANITRNDEGYYYCNATYDFKSSVSNIAYVQVHYPPKILRHPSRFINKLEKQTLTLTCQYEGKPMASVEWFKDGTRLNKHANARLAVTKAGNENNATSYLTITNLNRTDEGDYKCVVSNSIQANIYSNEAELTIHYPAKILQSPSDTTKIEKKDVILTCQYEGKPLPSVKWMKDYTELKIHSNPRMSIFGSEYEASGTSSLKIINIKRIDEGKYNCVVNNSYSTAASVEAQLIVNYPAKILIPPSSTTKLEKDNVQFICKYEGKPMSNAMWIKNGAKLSPRSNSSRFKITETGNETSATSSLTIANLTRVDVGKFLCLVENIYEIAFSKNAWLLVNYPSKILKSSLNVTKLERENVRVTCQYEGKPMSKVEWFKGGTKLKPQSHSRLIFEATGNEENANSSLTIKNLTRTDEGNYKCLVSNSYKNTSAETQITVHYPAKILRSLLNVTKLQNDNVTLTCKFEGKPLSSVKWLKNGFQLDPRPTSRLTKSEAGNESSSTSLLKITNLKRTDEGTYSCVVMNKYSNASSTVVQLIVNYPPKILIHPASKVLTENATLTLNCTLEGKPFPKVVWLKNGQPLDIHLGSPKQEFGPAENTIQGTFFLKFQKINRFDEGNYRCKATSGVGNVISSLADIVVEYPHKVLSHPSSVAKIEKESVTFTCQYEGKPMASVEWFKDGTRLNKQANARIAVTETGNENNATSYLTITNLNRTDEGDYKCAVSNSIQANVSSYEALLTVNYPAKILRSPSSSTKLENDNVTFTCQYEGKPISKVEWFVNGTKFDENSNLRYNRREIGSEYSATSFLMITNLSRRDEGNYTCLVSNKIKANIASAAALLIINYPAVILTFPSFTTTNESKMVRLVCKVEGKPQPSVSWFKDGTEVNINDSRILTTYSWSYEVSTSTLTILKTNRSDEGSYICRASNGIGSSVNSSIAIVTVNFPAKILISTGNTTRIEGQNVTFDCYFEGKPLSTVTWLKGSFKIDAQSGKYHISQSLTSVNNRKSSLKIIDVKRNDRGFYRCKVNNSLGADITKPAYLAINYPARVLRSPLPVTKFERETVTLACQYEGKPIPKVEWFVNSVKLDVMFRQRRLTVTKTGDAVKATSYLTISNLNRTDEGKYKCVGSNSIKANVSSVKAQLTVNYPSKILKSPSADSKLEHENATLTCHYEGKPVSNVEWTKNGINVNAISNPRLRVINIRNTKSCLTIFNLDRTDEGIYKCVVGYGFETNVSSAEAKLTVNYPSVILSDPRNETKVEEQEVKMFCELEGKPLVNVTWKKDGQAISNGGKVAITTPSTVGRANSTLTITNLGRGNEGLYSCTATNALNMMTSGARSGYLTINYPVVIFTDPQNATKLEGQNVTLWCEMEGKPLAKVTWKKDGQKVWNSGRVFITTPSTVGRAISTLTITSLEKYDNGLYSCTASNSLNTVTSSSFSGYLTVHLITIYIITPPSNQTTIEYQTVTLPCNVSGNPAPIVEWWKDGKLLDLSALPRLTQDSKTNTLTITSITRRDEGFYNCNATNNITSLSSTAYVQVNYPVKIMAPPSDSSKLERDDMLFSCQYQGKPMPIVDWIVNGTRLDLDSNRRLSRIERGDETSRISYLKISNLTRSDEGKYKCVVSNSIKPNVSSEEAQLIVNYPPSILLSPRSIISNETNNVTLTCEVEGKPNPKVNWLKNGAKVNTEDLGISLLRYWSYGRTIAKLIIRSANRYAAAKYACRASNGIGPDMTSSEAILTINYPAKILTSPKSATRIEGQNVTLTCHLEGKPLSTVKWWKDSTQISASDVKYHISEPPSSVSRSISSLTVINVKRSDEEFYRCKVQNDVGADVSSPAYFTVYYKPSIFIHPRNETKNEEQEVTLWCEVEGKPLVSVTWKKDGQELLNDGRTRISSPSTIGPANSTLTISNLVKDDTGWYTCTVTNEVNTVTSRSRTGYLTVYFLRHPSIIPTPSPYILKLGQANVTLSCSGYGFPRPILFWTKEETAINTSPQREAITSERDITSMLLLNEVTYEDAGEYTCEAFSQVLNKTSRTTIELLFLPEIQSNPVDIIKKEGEEATFYCNATGVPKPKISWNFRGEEKAEGNEITVKNVQNSNSYEGDYTCVAESRAGRAEAMASLEVDVPPRIINPFESKITLQLGETLALKCGVYGDPPPAFEWTYRNPKERDVDKSETIQRTNRDPTFTKVDMRVKNRGFYGCIARNRAGDVTVDSVFVDIDVSLAIINKTEHNVTTSENSTAILRCTASSKLTPTIKIYRHSRELDVIEVKKSSNDEEQIVTGRVVIDHVTTEDSGTYRCVAANSQKSVEADIRLVVDVPVKVELKAVLDERVFTEDLKNESSQQFKNLSAEFVREISSIYINYTEFDKVVVLGFSNGSVAVRFVVVFKVKVKKPAEKPGDKKKIEAANVIVKKVTQSSGVIGTIKIKTDSIKPQVVPPEIQNLTAVEIRKEEIVIQWRHPVYHEFYDVKSYILGVRTFGESSRKSVDVALHVDSYVFTGLEPGTSYTIKAQALNHVGPGIEKELEVKTLSAFWEMFAKVFTPIAVIIILVIIVVVVFYLRHKRNAKRVVLEEEEQLRPKEVYGKSKKDDSIELAELPKKWNEISRTRVSLGKELGSGAFGVVLKGAITDKNEDEEEGIPCAVKMLKAGASEEDQRDLYNELLLMASVEDHPNIVNLLGACTESDGPMYVIVEFAENGCLLEHLCKNRTHISTGSEASSLPNHEKMKFGMDVARGMQHLAKHKCVHRDLAARNVLLGKGMTAKVADFGLARDVYERGFYEKSTGGKLPARWMSIEALETMVATSESDVWSFGVLMWEIETGGKMPYAGMAFAKLLKSLKSGVRLPQPANCIDEMYAIMKDCWQADPSRRPTFEKLTSLLENLFIFYLED